MKTVILCGGRGTRAYPHTAELPKPLLEVGEIPVLRHVMEIYLTQGFNEFVLAAGFRADLIEGFASDLPAEFDVQVIDTGEETNKGDRVLMCKGAVDDPFCVTYGDGLGNVNIPDLLAFHASHGGLATVTTFPLTSQYGTIEFDQDGRVQRFVEKPLIEDQWINAGFMVFSGSVFDDWPGGGLETRVLPELSRRKSLFAYRHKGFWKSMDTHKDSVDLTAIYEEANEGGAPWLHFGKRASL